MRRLPASALARPRSRGFPLPRKEVLASPTPVSLRTCQVPQPQSIQIALWSSDGEQKVNRFSLCYHLDSFISRVFSNYRPGTTYERRAAHHAASRAVCGSAGRRILLGDLGDGPHPSAPVLRRGQRTSPLDPLALARRIRGLPEIA